MKNHHVVSLSLEGRMEYVQESEEVEMMQLIILVYSAARVLPCLFEIGSQMEVSERLIHHSDRHDLLVGPEC